MAATTEDRAYSGLPNKAVSAADGIDYAYRDTGGEAGGTLPLVWATRQAQYDAVCNWGVSDHAALQRVSAIKHPVFVANGAARLVRRRSAPRSRR